MCDTSCQKDRAKELVLVVFDPPSLLIHVLHCMKLESEQTAIPILGWLLYLVNALQMVGLSSVMIQGQGVQI